MTEKNLDVCIGDKQGLETSPAEIQFEGDGNNIIKEAMERYRDSDFKGALDLFRRASSQSPEDPDIIFNMTLCMLRAGLYSSHKEIMDLFNRILELNNRYQPALINMGCYLASCGNLVDALRAFDNAASIKDNLKVFENRGYVLYEIGNLERALVDFNRCLDGGIEKAEIFYRKGLILMEMKIFQESLDVFQKAENIGYENKKELTLSKAEIYLGMGKLGKAKEICDGILTNDNDSLRALGLRGIIYHYSGLEDYALKDLKKAKKLAREKGMERTQLVKILDVILEQMNNS